MLTQVKLVVLGTQFDKVRDFDSARLAAGFSIELRNLCVHQIEHFRKQITGLLR